MMSPKQVIAAVASRARSVSMDMKEIAEELDNIATTLPTAKDQALFKATTLSKPLRYVKSQSQPLPELNKRDKEMELNAITIESLNITKSVGGADEMDSKRIHVTIVLSRVLQCLLWDFGFRFTLLPHQIEAVFAVAGIKVSPLLDTMMTWDNKQLKVLTLLDIRKGEGKAARRDMCKNHIDFTKTRGLLLADAMGLGKTVESIAASFIRNGVLSIKLESLNEANANSLPTLIVGPNEAVLAQWEDNLMMSGVETDHIKYFNAKDKTILRHEEDFILVTRYSLMTEVRNLIHGEKSMLFPNLPHQTIYQLRELMAGSHKGLGDAKKSELITQVLCSNFGLTNWRYFRTLIIDEAHMMKNLATYWSIGVGLLASISQRSVPLSGTPFIHGPQDMATLMVFIDPSIPGSTKQWWKDATKEKPGTEMVKNVQHWRASYFVRREKQILAKELPTKLVSTNNVGSFGSELGVYHEHEISFFDALNAFSKLSKNQEDKRELVNFLFAQLTCMRMSLIHPLITKGREFTIKFSPSRRNLQVELSKGTQFCVCCKMGAIGAIRTDGTESKVVPVPIDMCYAANTPCPHYVHETCLNLLQSEVNSGCPRCKEFLNLAHVDPKVGYKIPHPIYSKNVLVARGVVGFKATSKIEQVVKWIKNIPREDKAIIYSFFEGSLDLLEGIFVENLNLECARFDDDVDSGVQASELSRFKNSPTCRILLATVQSSGCGLNIDEANHIAFLDRCFDTTVHQQAEDRSHNLRQKKDVEVTYFDGSMTVDEILKTLNVVASTQDTVKLADGTAVGKKEPTLKYDDLSGSINRMIQTISQERYEYLTKNPENALVPCKTNLVNVMSEKENVGKPVIMESHSSNSSQRALSDSSNVDRRVSFAPQQPIQRPPVTPRPSVPNHNYPTPYNYNYLTALQSPISPSFNYSSYHGYGMPLPVSGNNITRCLYPFAHPQGMFSNGSMQLPPATVQANNAKKGNSGVKAFSSDAEIPTKKSRNVEHSDGNLKAI